jgi:hypothetical protein
MMDYVSLKDRLLAATTALVIAGTCLAYSVRRRSSAGAADSTAHPRNAAQRGFVQGLGVTNRCNNLL